jgi:hypothetical protein
VRAWSSGTGPKSSTPSTGIVLDRSVERGNRPGAPLYLIPAVQWVKKQIGCAPGTVTAVLTDFITLEKGSDVGWRVALGPLPRAKVRYSVAQVSIRVRAQTRLATHLAQRRGDPAISPRPRRTPATPTASEAGLRSHFGNRYRMRSDGVSLNHDPRGGKAVKEFGGNRDARALAQPQCLGMCRRSIGMWDTCEKEGDLRGFRTNIAPRVRRSVLHQGVACGQRRSLAAIIQYDGDSAG